MVRPLLPGRGHKPVWTVGRQRTGYVAIMLGNEIPTRGIDE